MIIAKTPLRISFFSGGSDMPSFYKKESGAALSATIDKYIYVMVHDTPHLGIRTMYDIVETHQVVEKMQHLITKEALQYYEKTKEVTIASVSDILARGSGLGSSSAFTVGLMNALETSKRSGNGAASLRPSKSELAELACKVEMELCGYPVGKQDQYAAAFGGFNLFEFNRDATVNVNSFSISQETIAKLQRNLLLVYSGVGRMASNILQKQQSAMEDFKKFELVKRSRNKAFIAKEMLVSGDIDEFGKLLHEGWVDKKGVESSISNDYFDRVYEAALRSGATGGKLLGAGGGGFFLFYAPESCQPAIREAITVASDGSCVFYDFNFTDAGSHVVYHD